MGTILVSELFTRAGRILNDEGAVRWTSTEMLAWYNEGLLDAVTRLPALLPVVETFTCASGSQQAVPATRLAVIDVGRNLGPAAAPKNGAVPTMVKKDVMDQLHPTWQNDSAKSVVASVVVSPLTPKIFYVYPPQSATAPGRLEIAVSKKPTVVAVATGAIELDDEHAPIIIEYLLYRGMSKDSENPQLLQLSNQHLQNYLGMLGTPAPAQKQG